MTRPQFPGGAGRRTRRIGITSLLRLLVLGSASSTIGCSGGGSSRAHPAPPAAAPPATATTATTQPANAGDDAAALEKFDYVRPKMGTGFRIVLYAPDRKSADAAAEAAFARIDQLNAILSDYDPGSELSRLSRRTGDAPMPEPVKVGEDLWRVLEQSLEAARRSGGEFDVTIGPFVRLWRRSRDMGQLPTPERLEEARQSVGYSFLKLDPAAHIVQFLAPKMRLDVGGIAKGYASSQALAVLREQGITRAAVGAAGDLSVGDPPPGRRAWRIAIQSLPVNVASTRPATGPASAPTTVPGSGEATLAEETDQPGGSPDFGGAYVYLRNHGVSTSGDTQRFVIIGGKRYSHIIDPHTGLGMTRRIGATVIAPDDTTADWMATALCLLGPQKGLALVEDTPGAAARVVSLEGDRVRVYESRRFKQFTDRAGPSTFPSGEGTVR